MFNSTLSAELEQSGEFAADVIIFTLPIQNIMDTFQVFWKSIIMNEVSVKSVNLLVFSAFTLNDIWEMHASKAFESPTFDYNF
jgi:hypothetical protein